MAVAVAVTVKVARIAAKKRRRPGVFAIFRMDGLDCCLNLNDGNGSFTKRWFGDLCIGTWMSVLGIEK